jgi:mannitol-specific phosphotransferase system IIBC component
MIFTPRCSVIEVISTKHNNLIENCQKKKRDNFIEKCQKFCKNNRNNLINDVNVKFIEYTEDQGKGKSKMESIYLRAQEKLEDLDFKNIIKLHRLGITIAPYEALFPYINISTHHLQIHEPLCD